MAGKSRKSFGVRVRQYVITGILVVFPIWVTWLVFQFLFRILAGAGGPWIRSLAQAVADDAPTLARWLLEPSVQAVAGVFLIVVALYGLGWAATRVIGRQIVELFDRMVERIPLVHTIYGSTKKLVAVLQQRPDKVQRVVLIDFPSPAMKTVGFVTRTFTDQHTGQELAAVYVPTTPNPTSGYLEIVPLVDVISTDWTMNDAMTFVISGGAVGPESMVYSRRTEHGAP